MKKKLLSEKILPPFLWLICALFVCPSVYSIWLYCKWIRWLGTVADWQRQLRSAEVVPRVAMVTELMPPSSSVRVCQSYRTKPLGREPRSLWAVAYPHFFFPVVSIILPWLLRSIGITISSLQLNLLQRKFRVQTGLTASKWHKAISLSKPLCCKTPRGAIYAEAVLQGAPFTRIFSERCLQRLYWGTLLSLS